MMYSFQYGWADPFEKWFRAPKSSDVWIQFAGLEVWSSSWCSPRKSENLPKHIGKKGKKEKKHIEEDATKNETCQMFPVEVMPGTRKLSDLVTDFNATEEPCLGFFGRAEHVETLWFVFFFFLTQTLEEKRGEKKCFEKTSKVGMCFLQSGRCVIVSNEFASRWS